MHNKFITFSRNIFIPLTNICRNKCAYCGFRRDIGHPEAKLLTPSEVKELLSRGVKAGCSEALFTFGERPEEVKGFMPWLNELGYDNIIDYLVELCKLSIHMGLLPHSNPGILKKSELEKLKPYNASMGLMLETIAEVEAHKDSKGKNPMLRIKTIEMAGELGIPFTTGILIGIGETWQDRVDSLLVIKEIHERYGHIQEVIIQNFTPKPYTKMATFTSPSMKEMARVVTMARELLPEDVAIQIPPNLADPVELIKAGASDLGGISPITIDYINPEEPWPEIAELKAKLPLRERLPIYPKYVRKKWYSRHIAPLIDRLSDAEGFRKPYL